MFTAGCSGSPALPDGLQLVVGVVHTVDGKPLSKGGMIEFQSTTDPRIRSTSAINEKGEFSLQTANSNDKYPGAYPGIYEIKVYKNGSEYLPASGAANQITIAPQEQDPLEITVGEFVP